MMKHCKLVLLSISALTVALSVGHAKYVVNKKPPVWLVQSFQKFKIGEFPTKFRTYPFQRDKAKAVYQVAQEGKNKFFRAVDSDMHSVQVILPFYWDIERYPWAQWKWRARTLPTGADERSSETNDSACAIYIVYGQYTGKILKYTWSASAPVGAVVKKDPGKFHMTVVRSGPSANQNLWEGVTINVVTEYKQHFGGGKIRNPSGFGLLTDGNAVKKTAACDYDDFTIAEHDPRVPPDQSTDNK
jgi:hypothetical protein